MICPHCHFEFETREYRAPGNCPECGIRIARKVSGIVKTSTVMIATGDENGLYRSVQEVPESLRRRLIQTTNSENSGMIVIADQAGKEQWTELVAHRGALQSPQGAVDGAARTHRFAGLSWSAWAGILLFLAAGAMIASVFQIVR